MASVPLIVALASPLIHARLRAELARDSDILILCDTDNPAKAVAEITEILFPLAEHVIATRADNPRSASPGEIRETAARTGAEIIIQPTVAAALQRARELVSKGGGVVITGSIYVVGEALNAIGSSGD